MLADRSNGPVGNSIPEAAAINAPAQVQNGIESHRQSSVKASWAPPGIPLSTQTGSVRQTLCVSPRITKATSPHMVSQPGEDRIVQRQHSAAAISYSSVPAERQPSMQLLPQDRQQSSQQSPMQLTTQAVGYATVPGSLHVSPGRITAARPISPRAGPDAAARPISPRTAGPFVPQARGISPAQILSPSRVRNVENRSESEQPTSGTSPQVVHTSPQVNAALAHPAANLNILGSPAEYACPVSFLPQPRPLSPVPGMRVSQPLSNLTSIVNGAWPAATGHSPRMCAVSPRCSPSRPFGNP